MADVIVNIVYASLTLIATIVLSLYGNLFGAVIASGLTGLLVGNALIHAILMDVYKATRINDEAEASYDPESL